MGDREVGRGIRENVRMGLMEEVLDRGSVRGRRSGGREGERS